MQKIFCVSVDKTTNHFQGISRDTNINCPPKWDSPSSYSSVQRGVQAKCFTIFIASDVSQYCLQTVFCRHCIQYETCCFNIWYYTYYIIYILYTILFQQVFPMMMASDQGWMKFLPSDYSYSLLPPEAIRWMIMVGFVVSNLQLTGPSNWALPSK